uniref:Uncharacterized protein n=1 Tax=Vespula pensylvanica TaxID=30213 RepID=A0A834JM50_VESPE|nr:hypothetical protein H0235_017844 [Vespula pensylvanica]
MRDTQTFVRSLESINKEGHREEEEEEEEEEEVEMESTSGVHPKADLANINFLFTYIYISAAAISLRDITSVPPAATATATAAVAATAAATVAATAVVATLLYDRLRGFGGERLFIRMRMHMPDTHIRFMSLQWSLRISW